MQPNDCIKQRHEHNNLATICKEKIQGSPWAPQQPLACLRTQMQTLTNMDKRVSEDYYHMTTMIEC